MEQSLLRLEVVLERWIGTPMGWDAHVACIFKLFAAVCRVSRVACHVSRREKHLIICGRIPMYCIAVAELD